MKQLWFFAVLFLLLQGEPGFSLTVTGVKVSVTSDSAASAREKALTDAHELAFQQLLKEHFPDSPSALPPQDTLMNMVSNFSIEKEKTTPQSYAASLTFQFDEPQVQAWLQQAQSSSSPSLAFDPSSEQAGTILQITASYANFSQWHHIKKALEGMAGIQNMRLTSLSPTNAQLEVRYVGKVPQLQESLQHKKLKLESQGEGWAISADEASDLPKIV